MTRSPEPIARPAVFEPEDEIEAWSLDELDGLHNDSSFADGLQGAHAAFDD